MTKSVSWDSTDPHDAQAVRPGVVTLWFVSAADPAAVLAHDPDYDRGFGRKFLALYDSRLSVTPIGDFPLNRSAEAGTGEFYIGGFDGLAVVQTVIPDCSRLSQLPSQLRDGIAATDVYAIAVDDASGFGAFAHWQAGTLKRAFSASRVRILEDEGLPAPSEGDFWAGRFAPTDESDQDRPQWGVGLPFIPAQLAHAVLAEWLGFDPQDSPYDIPVCAFAVDGRRVDSHLTSPSAAARYLPTDTAADEKVAGVAYDDYEDYDDNQAGSAEVREKLRALAETATHGATRIGRAARDAVSWVRTKLRRR